MIRCSVAYTHFMINLSKAGVYSSAAIDRLIMIVKATNIFGSLLEKPNIRI